MTSCVLAVVEEGPKVGKGVHFIDKYKTSICAAPDKSLMMQSANILDLFFSG